MSVNVLIGEKVGVIWGRRRGHKLQKTSLNVKNLHCVPLGVKKSRRSYTQSNSSIFAGFRKLNISPQLLCMMQESTATYFDAFQVRVFCFNLISLLRITYLIIHHHIFFILWYILWHWQCLQLLLSLHHSVAQLVSNLLAFMSINLFANHS